MKRKRKIILWIAIVLFILFCACWSFTQYFTNKRILIIYNINHSRLLQACRTVIMERRAGLWEKEMYFLAAYKPGELKLPEPILEIRPSYVWIDKDSVMIEMVGGLAHFGVMAYAADIQKDGIGNRELVPGLWYYDDGYIKNPNWDKYIQSLKPD